MTKLILLKITITTNFEQKVAPPTGAFAPRLIHAKISTWAGFLGKFPILASNTEQFGFG